MVPALLLVAAVVLVGSPFVVNGAPYEASMGIVSKIFYFHVPFAAVMLTSTFVSGIASAFYLIRRKPMADYVALAAGELVTVFGIFVLVSGPLWARKAWGVWWVWEPRLTMTLVMWMIFSAYQILRRFGGPGTDVLGAVVAIFGMAVAPFVYWSVNMWRGMHPQTSVVPTLPESMRDPLMWCMAGIFALYAALVLVRARVERNRAALEAAYIALED
jgi:heme exporter protein C